MQLPRHGVVVRIEGRSEPGHLSLQPAFALAHHAWHAQASQQFARVVDVQAHVHHCAALGGVARTLARQQRPVAAAGELGLGRAQVELGQAPFARCVVAAAAVLRLNLQLAQVPPAELEVLNHDVQCRQRAGLLVKQLVHGRGRALWQRQTRQACMESARRVAHRARVVLHVARELARVQAGLPGATVLRCAHNQVVQCASVEGYLVGAQGQAGWQVVLHGVRWCVLRAARQRFGQLFPGVYVDVIQPGVGRYPGSRQVRRFARAHADAAAQYLRLCAAQVAQVLCFAQGAQIQRQKILQWRLAARRCGFARELFVEAQGLGGIGLFVQWRGQFQRHALQGRRDLQLGYAAAHCQGELVGRAATGVLRQARQQAQFVRLAQPFRSGKALGPHLHRGVSAAHAPFQAHLAAQRLRAHPGEGEAGVAELHGTTHARQHRCVGRDLHLVAAREGHAALHA